MTGEPHINDEELTAYLDGEAPRDLVLKIEESLPNDPDLRRRLEALEFPRPELELAMDRLAEQAPAMPELPTSPARERHASGLIAACIAAALLIGGGAGYLLSDSGQQDWMGYVAAYQSLYVEETLSGVEEPPAEASATLVDLGDILGLDLTRVSDDPVLRFKRAQLLGFQGKPLIQIAYLSPAGDPVALCITPIGDGSDRPVTVDVLEGLAAASWSREGFGFLVIGGSDQTAVRMAAERFGRLL